MPIYLIVTKVQPLRQYLRKVIPVQKTIRYAARVLRLPFDATASILNACSALVGAFAFGLRTIEEGSAAREKIASGGDVGYKPVTGMISELEMILKAGSQVICVCVRV